MGKNCKLRYGFTLIELSIVLVVVGILIIAGLKLGNMQIEAAKVRKTKEKLDKIEQALQMYYEFRGHLPCPVTGSFSNSDEKFGTSDHGVLDGTYNGGDCVEPNSGNKIGTDAWMGVVPVRSLMLPDSYMLDAWDNRISYIVARRCVNPLNWLLPFSSKLATTYTSGTATTSPYGCVYDNSASHNPGGNIVIKALSLNTSTSYAVYALVSHGKNGLGAFPDAGTARITSATNSSNEERKNAKLSIVGADNYSDTIFYDDEIRDYTGAGANYFDDIVRWKTGSQMIYEKNN